LRYNARVALDLNMLALALLGAAAVAFTRQRRLAMFVCGSLFVGTAALGVLAVWWPVSPPLAVVLLAAGLGLPLAGLLLFAVDLAFAPFCIEMTYPAMLCWLFWPAVVLANYVGIAIR
jgi:hypothetical protein